jgi:polysaccharide biosynthesis transport protein
MLENVAQPEEKHEAHLLDYWRKIWRGRWTVLGAFVVVVTLVAIGTFTQTPIFQAQVTVEISPQSRKVAPVADVSDMGTANYGWFAEERYFNTQYEIIKSRDVAQKVFDRLDLYNHPRFKKSSDPVGELAAMIDVEPIKDTAIVRIRLEGTNPEEVATWANAIGQAYVDRNLDQAVQATATAVKSLLQEVAPLRVKMQDSQQTSFDVAAKDNLYVPENQQKITNDRLSTLQTDLTDTQVKRSEIESLLKKIDEIRQNTKSYETFPQISNDPVIQELYRAKVGLEREYEKLLVTYKDKHVRVLEKQSEIEKTDQKIASEVERNIGNLRTQYALLKEHEDKLSRAIDDTRAESMRVNQRATTYELVRGEANDTKRIYDLITARIREIDLSSSLLNNNLRILDKAIAPKFPAKPRVVLNMAIGIVLGLFLGVGVIFFLDYIDNTIRTAEDVEQFLRLNLLAVVPKQVDETSSAVKEAYLTLRTSLMFSRKGRAANVLLVTSAGPKEGKSCTVVNVAKTLASSGEKTIILDCDLRRPTIHQRLGVSRDGGITNYLLSAEDDNWRNYVKSCDQPNLYAMTSGPIPPNPVDVFGHERFQKLLKEVRQEFDWVFVDSPPVVSLADATVLASVADMVAFVIKHSENDRELIRRCVTNIRKVNPNVIGAVLNHVDLVRAHYKDYYYVGYYYYGESTSKKGRKRKESGTLTAVSDPDVKGSANRLVG